MLIREVGAMHICVPIDKFNICLKRMKPVYFPVTLNTGTLGISKFPNKLVFMPKDFCTHPFSLYLSCSFCSEIYVLTVVRSTLSRTLR
jgi:hypothetical protein